MLADLAAVDRSSTPWLVVAFQQPYYNSNTAHAGEGAALAEKGAIEKARRDLARLEGLCGVGCAQTKLVAAAISRGAEPKVVTAEAMKPHTEVSAN